MKIGKVTVPRTAICTSDEHTIVVRGRDLSKALIGKVSFVEHFFLLLNGRMPSAGEAAVLNATLVAIAWAAPAGVGPSSDGSARRTTRAANGRSAATRRASLRAKVAAGDRFKGISRCGRAPASVQVAPLRRQ